jgi:PAS domain S-box-containing protein
MSNPLQPETMPVQGSLQQQLLLLQSVLAHATDAVLITEAEPLDAPGPRILYANPAFTRMTGYSEAEVLGRTPRLLQGPGSDRRVLDQIRGALATWQPVEVELLNYRKDGSEFWVELSVSPVADPGGWFTHWIAIQRDITARKRGAEQRERERAEILEASVGNVALPEVLSRLLSGAQRQFGHPVALRLSGGECLGGGPSGGGKRHFTVSGETQSPPDWIAAAHWSLPLLGQAGAPLGHLMVQAALPMPASEQPELEAAARLAALVIERDAGQRALQDAAQQAAVLSALSDALQQALTPQEAAQWALGQLGPALGARNMLVVRLKGEHFGPPTIWGELDPGLRAFLENPGLTLEQAPGLSQVARSGKALYLDSYHEVPGALEQIGGVATGVEPIFRTDGNLQGFLVCWRDVQRGGWQVGEQELMRRAAETLQLALERAESQAQIAEQRQELWRANLELQRERTFLSAVLANLSEGVVACDEQGQLTLFNDATRRFHGVDAAPMPPAEWAGHYDLFGADGVSPLETQQVPLYRAWQGERVREAEMVVRSKTGAVRHLLANGQPMLTAGGEVLGAVVTMRDVTARKAAELELGQRNEALLRSNAELRAANDELEAFTYSASHDLRTPVRHIKSFAELSRKALSNHPNAKALVYLSRVETAAEQMSALIDAMLVLSRSTRQALELLPVDLSVLVGRLIHDAQPDLQERNVEWRLGALPVVIADQVTVSQVLGNLLANALKFTRPRAQAVIEVWAEARESEWLIQVRDNGVGFDPAYTHRLFGAFQRLHVEHEFEGTGVGLATVRRIVLRHGGRVEAEGRLGEGATFGFSLPRA